MTANVELLPLPEPDAIIDLLDHSTSFHSSRPLLGRNVDVYYAATFSEYVAHATAAKDAEVEALRAKTAVTMGVGAGDGKLFVHGDYESIKAAQEIVLERDALRAERDALAAALEAAREDASIERRALLWLAGGDSGKSSEAICHHMLGMESDGSFPWDPADLGRCLRLLELFPEWKPRIGEMARYSAQWAALVERWDELAEMMADEVGIDWSKGKRAQLTYAAMQEAIDQARGKGGGEVGP